VSLSGTKSAELRFDLKKPCKDCPFLKTTPHHEGVASDLMSISTSIESENAAFTCHKTDPRSDSPTGQRHTGPVQHCAGFILMCEKGKTPQVPYLTAWCSRQFDLDKLDKSAPVYDSFMDMVRSYGHWIKGQLHRWPGLEAK